MHFVINTFMLIDFRYHCSLWGKWPSPLEPAFNRLTPKSGPMSCLRKPCALWHVV